MSSSAGQLPDPVLTISPIVNESPMIANPAVSSDLMLLMRYALPPGAEYGRPLEVSEAGLWVVHDGYPGPDWTPPETEGNRRTRGGIGS